MRWMAQTIHELSNSVSVMTEGSVCAKLLYGRIQTKSKGNYHIFKQDLMSRRKRDIRLRWLYLLSREIQTLCGVFMQKNCRKDVCN